METFLRLKYPVYFFVMAQVSWSVEMGKKWLQGPIQFCMLHFQSCNEDTYKDVTHACLVINLKIIWSTRAIKTVFPKIHNKNRQFGNQKGVCGLEKSLQPPRFNVDHLFSNQLLAVIHLERNAKKLFLINLKLCTFKIVVTIFFIT